MLARAKGIEIVDFHIAAMCLLFQVILYSYNIIILVVQLNWKIFAFIFATPSKKLPVSKHYPKFNIRFKSNTFQHYHIFRILVWTLNKTYPEFIAFQFVNKQ